MKINIYFLIFSGSMEPEPAHQLSKQSESGLDNSAFVPDEPLLGQGDISTSGDTKPGFESLSNFGKESKSGAAFDGMSESMTSGGKEAGESCDPVTSRPASGVLRPGRVSTRDRLREFGLIKVSKRPYSAVDMILVS